MTQEELKQKKIEFIQEVIYRAAFKEPKLTADELAFAFLYHLDSEEFLKAIKKEAKSKW